MKIKSSKELTWLNEIALFSSDNIKIQQIEPLSNEINIQETFKKYAKNPDLYLGNLAVLKEIKESITSIKEFLENLSAGQVISPMRNLAVEFENICKRALKYRLPEIYENFENKRFGISEILQALHANYYLRKSKFHFLHDDKRSLRNSIIHIKKEDVKYAEAIQYCNELKNGIRILLEELYFSDMLRNSEDLIKDLQEIEEFKFKSPKNIKEELLRKWSDELLEFVPKIDERPEIASYSGVMKINIGGKEHPIKIDLVI